MGNLKQVVHRSATHFPRKAGIGFTRVTNRNRVQVQACRQNIRGRALTYNAKTATTTVVAGCTLRRRAAGCQVAIPKNRLRMNFSRRPNARACASVQLANPTQHIFGKMFRASGFWAARLFPSVGARGKVHRRRASRLQGTGHLRPVHGDNGRHRSLCHSVSRRRRRRLVPQHRSMLSCLSSRSRRWTLWS